MSNKQESFPVTTGGIQTVTITFEILEELSKASAAVGVTELARRLGQTKARVHRHLSTLKSLGYVSQNDVSDRYQLGWKIYRLGMSVAENFGLRRLAHQHVEWLATVSGLTAMLAMPANTEVIVIDAVQSTNNIAITVKPGAVIPASSSALGRTILAFESDDIKSLVLTGPLSQLTEKTLSDKPSIESRLKLITERWYETANSERLIGIAAVAAPVFDDNNQIVASIGLIGSQSILSQETLSKLIQQAQEAARRLSEELGSTAWNNRI